MKVELRERVLRKLSLRSRRGDLPRGAGRHLHDVTERTRVATTALAGVAAGVASAVATPWQFAFMVGWVVAGSFLVSWIWLAVWNLTGVEVESIATREDNSRASARAVVLGASVASLVGVALGLTKANDMGGCWKAALTVAAIATVATSWFAVHSLFALRYTHLYYDDPVGGIDFSGEERPDYRDFAYLAFTIGMTFQVSDTAVSSRLIRRTVTRHALLAYLFGTVIVAMLINVTAGLIG